MLYRFPGSCLPVCFGCLVFVFRRWSEVELLARFPSRIFVYGLTFPDKFLNLLVVLTSPSSIIRVVLVNKVSATPSPQKERRQIAFFIVLMLKQQSDKALQEAKQAQEAGQFEDAFKSLKLAIRYPQ
jgi:hypothetical protein